MYTDRYCCQQRFWACLAEGFKTLVSAVGLNLPDKRVDPDYWLRSGFESPRRQLGFRPLSRSHQLLTLHCRAMLVWTLFGGLMIYSILLFSISIFCLWGKWVKSINFWRCYNSNSIFIFEKLFFIMLLLSIFFLYQ